MFFVFAIGVLLAMPRKKRKLTEMSDKEAIRKLFPKKVVEEADRVAHEKDAPKSPSRR